MHPLIPLLVAILAVTAPTHSAAQELESKLCECPKPQHRRMFTLSIYPTKEKCLEFGYRIKESADRNLTVALKIGGVIGAPIWSAVRGSGEGWNNATVDITERKQQYMIAFEGVRHADRKGRVAIRNLIIHDGACSGDEVKTTVIPTLKPTLKPSMKPTVKPTLQPTEKPTVKPTLQPTVKPTDGEIGPAYDGCVYDPPVNGITFGLELPAGFPAFAAKNMLIYKRDTTLSECAAECTESNCPAFSFNTNSNICISLPPSSNGQFVVSKPSPESVAIFTDCQDIEECRDSPCKNAGTCVNANGSVSRYCICRYGWTGDVCEMRDSSKRKVNIE
ncbi:uncharacterized protein LOC135491667 [Lineus longissimus]|uniref:uncharacterized protein LOC135491667 n=1 Tax=Lineus longissimus TaxID=88925 RepID=UPI002B4F7C53